MIPGFHDKRTGQVKGRQCHLCPHYMNLPPGTDYFKSPCAQCYGVGDLEARGGATDSREQGHGRVVSADTINPSFLAVPPAPVGEDAVDGGEGEGGEAVEMRETVRRIVYSVAQLSLPELVGIWARLRGHHYKTVAPMLRMTPQGVHISTVRGLKRLGVWDVWQTNVKARKEMQARMLAGRKHRTLDGLGTRLGTVAGLGGKAAAAERGKAWGKARRRASKAETQSEIERR